MKPVILKSPREMREWRRSQTKSVGFVPTMGALHAGHATLLERARAENEKVVLSIYVNKTQFNDPSDFEKYPITWESDLALARELGVDAVFAPIFEGMYPDGYRYRVSEDAFSRELCGAHRPGHFDGVLTVVLKLFQLVDPTRAYFGEKDCQQLALIRGMTEAFFLDLQVVPVPTVREQDGLAMSSRNKRLTPSERERAPLLARILREAPDAATARERLGVEGFRVDYVEDRDGRRFAAAFLGDVRLIDNVEV